MRIFFLVVLSISFVLLSACGDDGDGEGHTAAGHEAPRGVVSPKPDDAAEVRVTLREWAVAPARPSVNTGKVYFLVENAGPDHPHELKVVRSHLGPLSLPFENNAVPEDTLDIVGKIEDFAPNSAASVIVDLPPGSYLLICNITEQNQAIGNHYKKGMVAALTVE